MLDSKAVAHASGEADLRGGGTIPISSEQSKSSGRRLFGVIALIVNLALIVHSSSDFSRGARAQRAGNFVQAIEWYRRAAERGDANAQNNIGFLYDKGLGVGQEYTQAALWYRKAAEQGNADAQNNIGLLYTKGLGVPQDYTEAMQWFRKASDQGSASAQGNIGFLYERGLGVSQDYAEAIRWYRRAAERGDANAQNNIGILYQNGLGVAQDYMQAERWFRKGAVQGSAPAENSMGVLYERGLGIGQDYSHAMYWYHKAADQGDAMAQSNIGSLYMRGLGVAQDYAQAALWYSKAAEQGNPAAEYQLGVMSENGLGMARNYVDAIKWLNRAAAHGNAAAVEEARNIGTTMARTAFDACHLPPEPKELPDGAMASSERMRAARAAVTAFDGAANQYNHCLDLEADHIAQQFSPLGAAATLGGVDNLRITLHNEVVDKDLALADGFNKQLLVFRAKSSRLEQVRPEAEKAYQDEAQRLDAIEAERQRQLTHDQMQLHAIKNVRGCLHDNSTLAMEVICIHSTFLSSTSSPDAVSVVRPIDERAQELLQEARSNAISEVDAKRQLSAFVADWDVSGPH
jgi:TPR repeat protein